MVSLHSKDSKRKKEGTPQGFLSIDKTKSIRKIQAFSHSADFSVDFDLNMGNFLLNAMHDNQIRHQRYPRRTIRKFIEVFEPHIV